MTGIPTIDRKGNISLLSSIFKIIFKHFSELVNLDIKSCLKQCLLTSCVRGHDFGYCTTPLLQFPYVGFMWSFFIWVIYQASQAEVIRSPSWLLPIISLTFTCLAMVFKINCTISFTEIKLRLTGSLCTLSCPSKHRSGICFSELLWQLPQSM